MTQYLILRRFWSEAINQWEEPGAIDAIPATHRLLASGADRSDVAYAVRTSPVFATATAGRRPPLLPLASTARSPSGARGTCLCGRVA
ncbi:hypothetical protein [Streptomyces sp. NPDC048340]|uniref:hypothetical protein n=1 Tax=Streptomyces sp. NPDC048340 TaxID=3365537 RepID=UPI00371A7C74